MPSDHHAYNPALTGDHTPGMHHPDAMSVTAPRPVVRPQPDQATHRGGFFA